MNQNNNENRYVGTNWDPRVRVKYNGKNHNIQRKVKAEGIENIKAGNIYNRLVDLLRQGYEVRLVNDDGEQFVRFYQLVTTDCKKMYVGVRTMEPFTNHTLADKKFKISHCGEEYDAVDFEVKHNDDCDDDVVNVTPDTMVKCPECGKRFRVGKQLA